LTLSICHTIMFANLPFLQILCTTTLIIISQSCEGEGPTGQ
jgi:hypothetical protein